MRRVQLHGIRWDGLVLHGPGQADLGSLEASRLVALSRATPVGWTLSLRRAAALRRRERRRQQQAALNLAADGLLVNAEDLDSWGLEAAALELVDGAVAFAKRTTSTAFRLVKALHLGRGRAQEGEGGATPGVQ